MTEHESPEPLERLLEHLKQSRGFDFTAYKRATLARRIDKRRAAVGAGSYEEYEDYLEVHPDEFEHLFNVILINVTSFFRDPETFDFLRSDAIPALLKSKRTYEPIRIWSAGCASGEECYSLAMLMAEALGESQYRERVKIYATDLDEAELVVARQASYTERQVQDVPAELRQKYFDANGDRWMFRKDLRRSVIFGRHDLLDDAPISRVDLLVCRNTLMYFNLEAQAKIVSRFHYALREGGYLVLGRAEMLVNFADVFAPTDLKLRVFTKIRPENGQDRVQGAYVAEARPAAAGTSHRLRDISFEQDPTAQIVLDERRELLATNARARELFNVTLRDVGRPLQDLELSYRPVDIRSCIDDADARRQVVHLREVAWPAPGGQPRYFNVQVTPIFDAADTLLGTKIIFLDVSRQHELQEDLQRSRQELETAYEELQSTNEELETTNEELQSTVEELETTNEELQSSNEELETMNEELESTNSELQTINGELRQRTDEVEQVNGFMESVLRGLQLGVVVVDADLRVKMWYGRSEELWGLRPGEVYDQPLMGLDIGLPLGDVRRLVRAVLAGEGAAQEAVVVATNRRGRTIHCRIVASSSTPPGSSGPNL